MNKTISSTHSVYNFIGVGVAGGASNTGQGQARDGRGVWRTQRKQQACPGLPELPI